MQLTQGDLSGSTRVVAPRTKERKGDDPTEVRGTHCSERPWKQGPNAPGRARRGSESVPGQRRGKAALAAFRNSRRVRASGHRRRGGPYPKTSCSARGAEVEKQARDNQTRDDRNSNGTIERSISSSSAEPGSTRSRRPDDRRGARAPRRARPRAEDVTTRRKLHARRDPSRVDPQEWRRSARSGYSQRGRSDGAGGRASGTRACVRADVPPE